MDIFNALGGQEVCCVSQEQAISPSVLDTLKRRQQELNMRLADVNAAIEALEKNPEVTKVLELLARAR